MGKYRVWAKVTSNIYVDIEADNKDKAKEIASGLDDADFTIDGCYDWEYGDTAELDDDCEVMFSQKEFEEEE